MPSFSFQKTFLCSAFLTLIAPPSWAGKKQRQEVPPPEGYRAIAAELTGKAMVSDEAYEKLVELCDGIGHRLSGSPSLDRAIEWAVSEMKNDGLHAYTEPIHK